ncbi:LysM peptidoglycan-binding domain-containing protein [Isobaculum melis]|uniref:LysM peptidoglycan-binding domain-containing protein n=1 Tax=Isobaculum melis TaxID=142588 RepID=UPI0015A60695|nr:LysM peptidoglycan-binding domain-containing protein [Isobaculum melis]
MSLGTKQEAPKQSYLVKSGDALSLISERLGVSMAHLIHVNQISHPDFIRAGEILYY